MQSQDRAGRARRGGGRGMRAVLGAAVAVAFFTGGVSAAQATPTVSFASKTASITEGDTGTSTVSLTINAACGLGDVTSNTSFNVVLASGTAASGSDFASTAAPASVMFSCLALGIGGGSATTAITINGDNLNEADENLTARLTDTAGTTLDTATVTITNDDPLPVATVGAPATVSEGTGTAGPGLVFPVSLDKPSGRDVSVKYGTDGGTATAGSDYTATTGTLVIPAGSTSRTVTVPVTPDAVDEGDETVGLTLSLPPSPVVALGAPATQTGTILDDDTATITVTGASVLEGTSATPTMTNAVVNLSTTSAQPVTVFYGTVAGTATETADYEPAVGQVTVPAGQRTAFIPLKIVADALPEPDETFSVTIGGPTGAAIAPGGATATVTIRNDDVAAPGTTDVPGTTPGTSSSPLPPAVPAAADAIRLGRLAYRRTDSTMRFVVQCPPSAGRCRGTVTVFSVPVRRSKVKALRTEQQLGSKRFDINAVGTLTVAVRLSTKAKGWLRTAKSVPITAYAVCSSTQTGISTARVKGTLHR